MVEHGWPSTRIRQSMCRFQWSGGAFESAYRRHDIEVLDLLGARFVEQSGSVLESRVSTCVRTLGEDMTMHSPR